MKTVHLLLFVAGLIYSLNLNAQNNIDVENDPKNEYQTLRSSNYVRVTDLSQLYDGCNIIFASRHDADETSFYAMPNQASGKPEGVLFTSSISNGECVLPSEIVDNELDYLWVLSDDAGVFTFTNDDGDMIGYNTSGTDFVRNGTNSTWTVEAATSGEGTSAPNHNAFIITNVGAPNRSFAFRKFNNDAVYEKFAPYTNSESNMNGDTYFFYIDIFVDSSQPMDVVATPTFTPEAGSYQSTQYVDIGCTTDGAIIYYTTDGSAPDAESEVFVESIEVANDMIIKAIAMKEGMLDSDIAEASYIISEPVTVTFYENGELLDIYELAQGAEIGDMPEAAAPSGYTFKGWTESLIATYMDDAPAMIEASTIVESDMTLYAVYAIDYNAWEETALSDINTSDVVMIAVSHENEYFAMSQTVGSSGQPTAEEIVVENNTVTAEVNDALKWNVLYADNSMIIYPNGVTDNWLYCNSGSNNNSLRIGDNENNNVFEMKTVEINEVVYPNYLYNISTSRFVGVYFDDDIALDWRAYRLTSTGAFPNNIKDQTYHFYKYSGSKFYCTDIDIPESQTISEDITWTNVSVSNQIVIENGATLTIDGAMTSTDVNNIIIKDGAQLIHNNAGVMATVEKEIGGYASGAKDGVSAWFTISSAMSGSIPLTDIHNLIPENDNYDLYRYDEPTCVWQNVKDETNNFITFDAGRGYLYANEHDATLSFVGELNSAAQTYYLTKTDDKSLSGFHLIGNPYTHKIYKGKNAAIDNVNLATGYYVITGEGAWQPRTYLDAILPAQGLLVKTTKAENLYIEKTTEAAVGESTASRSENNGMLLVSVTNKNYEDVAYISFGEGHGLDKIPHQNDEIQMIYVDIDEGDFAIAMIDNDVTEIPLSFRAKTMGEYTIRVSPEEKIFEKLYLTDRMTGVTTNMIVDDYTFIATTNDDPQRFVLSLDELTSVDNGNIDDLMIYISGKELIINGVYGRAVLAVSDVLGRCIVNDVIINDVSDNGRDGLNVNTGINLDSFTPGVYVIRLMDDNGLRTQKIIIE